MDHHFGHILFASLPNSTLVDVPPDKIPDSVKLGWMAFGAFVGFCAGIVICLVLSCL